MQLVKITGKHRLYLNHCSMREDNDPNDWGLDVILTQIDLPRYMTFGHPAWPLGLVEEMAPWGEGRWRCEYEDDRYAYEDAEEYRMEYEAYPVRFSGEYLYVSDWDDPHGAFLIKKAQSVEEALVRGYDPERSLARALAAWNAWLEDDYWEILIEVTETGGWLHPDDSVVHGYWEAEKIGLAELQRLEDSGDGNP